MSKKAYRPMRALILAGVLSLAAASAVQAGGKGGMSGEFHSGAKAAPICDGTGRSQKPTNDGRLSRDWCRVIATDGPGGPGDNNGRTAEGTHAYPVLASISDARERDPRSSARSF